VKADDLPLALNKKGAVPETARWARLQNRCKNWLRILLYWGRIQSISLRPNSPISNDDLCRGFYVQAFVIAGKERKNPLQSICSDTRALG
tara:strand:- start:52 stop:321 length:270 start_codon:yes stop_codon:yes gene_type:complete